MCIRVYTCVQVLLEARKGRIRSLETRVMGGYKLPDMGAGL